MYKLQFVKAYQSDTVNIDNNLLKRYLKFLIVGNFMTVLQCFQNRITEELESYEWSAAVTNVVMLFN